MSIPVPSKFAAAAEKKVLTVLGAAAEKELKKYLGKDHGSKVKEGAYHECSIALFGDKACIIVDADKGEVVFLTSETIRSCEYVKEKERVVGLSRHTYYYYTITFRNGTKSYVRMRRKYRDAMERYTTIQPKSN